MILILGASSFIGGRFARSWPPGAYVGTFKSHPVAHSVHFDAMTMKLEDVLPAGGQFTHGIIFFAEPDIDACKADEARSYALNVQSAKSVITSLIRKGIKPVFMSSEQVFDGARGGYVETDAAAPITVYGNQKLDVERYLAESGSDFAVVRLAKVFGTDPSDKTIFAGWLRQIHRGEEIRCARDQVFSPVHVDDVGAAIAAMVRRNLSGIFHVSGPRAYSRLAMLTTLVERSGLPARIRECSIDDLTFLDRRAKDVSLSPQKILEASGLTFRTIESCCDELVQRYAATRVNA